VEPLTIDPGALGRALARRLGAPTLLVLVLTLAGCGGGGGGGTAGVSSAPVDPASGLVASSTVAQHCAAPRAGSADVQGTVLDEKTWVRSWIDETYLWYPDVRALSAATLNPAGYATAVDYFNALKSPLLTASGAARDRFHFVYDTPTWVALSQSGIAFGYGFEIALLSATPPRQALVAYTSPGTPAAADGIARGAQVLAVDGVDLVNDNTGAGVDALNAGLFPTAAGPHTFTLLDAGALAPRTVTLEAAALATATVQNVRTMPAPNQGVGYLQFNDHLATSEAELVAAVNQLKAAGITDLLLDLRYNGGGYLDIASELAYMIAGPGPTVGKVFEQQIFNDKNPFQLTAAQTVTPFHAVAQGFSVADGQALPTLNLPRVFVLTGAGTCSASEAIVNGLRGVGVEVDLIGATTCGKPYGFYPQDNCGTTYFSIQFEGVNQQGQGDYADGFTPTCAATDDFTHALGDPAEGRVAAALSYRATGVCAPPMARAQAAGAATRYAEPRLLRSPLQEMRLYRRP
jgi:hypothetical protein